MGSPCDRRGVVVLSQDEGRDEDEAEHECSGRCGQAH